MTDIVPIRRALLSVSDKTGLVDFATALAENGAALLSTGGSAALLKTAGLAVTEVADHTGFPEMMDGRVKTLHPKIHGGLLALRDDPGHRQAMAAHDIKAIDLVAISLYPFEATVARGADFTETIENIDIGGPAMIRAAAKNHASVTVIVDVADYAAVEAAMRGNRNAIPLARRQALAAKAFARCAAYDTLIASWLSEVASRQSPVTSEKNNDSPFPAYVLDAELKQCLRYGENPHQAAALYTRMDAKGGVANAQMLQGKELSYNNLADADAAWAMVSGFDAPAAALVKHANPCGVASAADATQAFLAALASDPLSAFGGILAVNRAVDAALVEAIGSLFLEVILAPEITPEARALLAAKKNLRLLLATPETHASPLSHWLVQAISGGYLVQQKDERSVPAADWKQVTGAPAGAAQMRDAQLAWQVVQQVKSNAIVLVKNGATIGVGAGQMSRVDAVRIAVEKARAHGHDPRGAVLASDAFFPFADNVERAAEAGISLIIQPGGSLRDAEVIDAANAHGIAMLFTGQRHFRH